MQPPISGPELNKIIVGLDRNNDSQDKVSYYYNGAWTTSPIEGALMMRPVFGRTEGVIFTVPESNDVPITLSLYPNPVSNELNITVDYDRFENDFSFRILDMYGRIVSSYLVDNSRMIVDVSGFSNGMYVLHLTDNNSGKSITKKFMVSK